MREIPWLFILAVIPLAIGVLMAAVEIASRDEMSWPRRISWWLALLIVPPIALALYVIVRPPRHRAAVAPEALGTERAVAVVDLVERHIGGTLTADEYSELVAAVRR